MDFDEVKPDFCHKKILTDADLKFRNERGEEGMVPSSYVEQIEEEPSAYQDVPDDDSDFSSEGGPNGSGKF